MSTSGSAAAVKEVEGIIFDLDGTLIDYEGASHEALERLPGNLAHSRPNLGQKPSSKNKFVTSWTIDL